MDSNSFKALIYYFFIFSKMQSFFYVYLLFKYTHIYLWCLFYFVWFTHSVPVCLVSITCVFGRLQGVLCILLVFSAGGSRDFIMWLPGNSIKWARKCVVGWDLLRVNWRGAVESEVKRCASGSKFKLCGCVYIYLCLYWKGGVSL